MDLKVLEALVDEALANETESTLVEWLSKYKKRTMKTYTGFIKELKENQIFVFGSNTQGRHGKGTAKLCLDKYGAIYGQASGLQGQSYGLITTDLTTYKFPSRSPSEILEEIKKLYKFAELHPDSDFLIAYTADGHNLCGYTSNQLANLFSAVPIPENIVFEDKFANLLK